MGLRNWPYSLKGGFIGLIFSLTIVLILLFFGAVEFHRTRLSAYERFKLCEPCGGHFNERGQIDGRDLNCVIKICESEAINLYDKSGYTNVSLSFDKFKDELCHDASYINGERVNFYDDPSGTGFMSKICGYNRFDRFNYGKDPTFVGSFLNTTRISELLTTLFYPPWVLVYLLPFIGALIGWIIGKFRSKKVE